MAAKLLHTLSDDNPDLRKQIGCWTGIFHIFDGRRILSGRRISGQSHHKGILPPGHSRLASDSVDAVTSYTYNQEPMERNSNKYVHDKRLSTESSRASFSSSSCSSSFSSLDCGRISQPDPSSFDRIILPEAPANDPVISQPRASSRLGRHSLDIRDVVKDSMYRESHIPAFKDQGAEKSSKQNLKHRLPADLKESLRVLAKLREAPRYYKENEVPKSVYKLKDGSDPRDAPRHSYDGRETSHLSQKVKDLPRRSLDSRESLVHHLSYDSKTTIYSRNMQRGSNGSNESIPRQNKSTSVEKRGSSVVAKLMGLDALPDAAPNTTERLGPIRTFSMDDNECASMLSKSADTSQSFLLLTSPRGSRKEPTSPRRKSQDVVMKPVASSKFPLEPAPWKHVDGSRPSQNKGVKQAKLPSVFNDIEKKLEDIEFKPSGKDLRALKQIIETMQAKGLMESTKEASSLKMEIKRGVERRPKVSEVNSGPVRQDINDNHAIASMHKRNGSSTGFNSSIVIMKPARFVQCSQTPINGLLHHRSNYIVAGPGSNNTVSERSAKDQISKDCDFATSSSGRKTSSRNSGASQTSTRSLPLPKDNRPSIVGNSGSTSPRLVQRKLDYDKRSRPPTAEASRRRIQANNQSSETCSPGGRCRPKSSTLLMNDSQLSESSSNSRILSCHGDHMSLASVNSNLEVDLTGRQASKRSVSGQVQGSFARLDSDDQARDCSTDARESSVPSPVSVLDASYREDSPSPVKQVPQELQDEEIMSRAKDPDQRPWNSYDETSSNEGHPVHSSEMCRQKLQRIDSLVQKLRQLNSTHDEARTDYIASLCENSNPDHRYVSEILLASGLLLRDLSSPMGLFQLHPSGHPVNPELFFVLEQTKAKAVNQLQEPENPIHTTKDLDKIRRKLMFDTVNEILAREFASAMLPPESWFRGNKLSWKSLNAQKLLRELCAEIDQLQPKELKCSLSEEDGDVGREKQVGDGFLNGVLWEDVMHRLGNWTEFYGDIPVVVLDIERSIFKDLVDEIVIGEATELKRTGSRCCRQLFTE